MINDGKKTQYTQSNGMMLNADKNTKYLKKKQQEKLQTIVANVNRYHENALCV